MKTYRTTVTLDSDVHRRLEQAWRRGGKSRKQTINELLRAGLDQTPAPAPQRVRLRKLDFGGLRPGFSDTSVSELIAQADALEGKFR